MARLGCQRGASGSARPELVVLQVTVRDGNGAYVEGLAQNAFSVIEDGQPQTVRLFSDADTYAVAYMPANAASDPCFRWVRVVAAAPHGRRLLVRTRAGYTAGDRR
jgi:hypothetical protein